MINLTDVLQMDGTVFAIWLQENREKYGLNCERLGQYLGVVTKAVEGFEEGYFCSQVYCEVLFKYFEEKERLRLERYSTKTELQTNSCLFGSWLKKQRLALGMTQKEFAAAIGVPTAPQISVYEHGKRLPSAQEQARIKKCVESLPQPQGSLSQKAKNPQIDGIPFGIWLKKQRLALGMTQKEFAVAVGLVRQSAISTYECGFRAPLLRTQACIEQRVKALLKSQGDRKLGSALAAEI